MYHVFPYRKTKLSQNLIISPTGEYAFCGDKDLSLFETNEPLPTDLYYELKTKHFLCDRKDIAEEEAIQRIRQQTKNGYLEPTTMLLMVVPTIECNCECIYCQVSSKKTKSRHNNMGFRTAYSFCEFALSLPHDDIKVEFQGGEPTLRMETIQFIVGFLEKHKAEHQKSFSYVICTNLLKLDKDSVTFISKYRIDISTSLDGDKYLHELNRPSHLYASTYETFKDSLTRLRDRDIFPSALLTVTRHNLGHIERVIDEYIALDFHSIFIRQLNNYGYAYRNNDIQYSDDEFMSCYTAGIRYMLKQNLENGVFIREEWLAILLKKVMTPFLVGFVDLQNPTALARMCLLVNHDGSIYPSDEARMIAEMGDKRFLLGDLSERQSYETMIQSSSDFARLHYLEEIDQCTECPYQDYCGADPVRYYYVSQTSKETFCGKRKKMFELLFTLIENATAPQMRLFRRWAND
jgi:uncharacterized protein